MLNLTTNIIKNENIITLITIGVCARCYQLYRNLKRLVDLNPVIVTGVRVNMWLQL